MSQQLVKKGSDGRYSNVMPNSWIEAIKDKSTGQTLVEILQGFNMYFLPYNGNTLATRCSVPMILRKKGLWITYVKYDGNVYTEWYAANKIDDKSWGDSSNWRIGNNTLVGDITISANGNWVINGTETKFKAVGEKGNTPLIRVANNRLQVSYDLGGTYRNVTENPVYTQFRNYDNKIQVSTDLGATWVDASDKIAAYFRWQSTSEDTLTNNVGRLQISRDNKTWTNLSNDIINNLHISKYIGVNESLPTSGIAEGTIYAKGPTYAVEDTSNSNPIYRLWVYAWKGNTLAWQDNGEFTSITAGIVQETGSNENAVMSQKATSEAIHSVLYDVSAHNDDAVFESLQALLSSSNLDTLIPASVRHGGMSIRFIHGSVPNSDNKYVQFRYMNSSTAVANFINVDNWQGIDVEPTVESNNIASSGGTAVSIRDNKDTQQLFNFIKPLCEYLRTNHVSSPSMWLSVGPLYAKHIYLIELVNNEATNFECLSVLIGNGAYDSDKIRVRDGLKIESGKKYYFPIIPPVDKNYIAITGNSFTSDIVAYVYEVTNSSYLYELISNEVIARQNAINSLELNDTTNSESQATELNLSLQKSNGEEPISTLDTISIQQVSNTKAGLLPAKNNWDDVTTLGNDTVVASSKIAKAIINDSDKQYILKAILPLANFVRTVEVSSEGKFLNVGTSLLDTIYIVDIYNNTQQDIEYGRIYFSAGGNDSSHYVIRYSLKVKAGEHYYLPFYSSVSKQYLQLLGSDNWKVGMSATVYTITEQVNSVFSALTALQSAKESIESNLLKCINILSDTPLIVDEKIETTWTSGAIDSNGQVSPSSNAIHSDYIPIDKGAIKYYINTITTWGWTEAYYTEQSETSFISGQDFKTTDFQNIDLTIPDNAKFMRVTLSSRSSTTKGCYVRKYNLLPQSVLSYINASRENGKEYYVNPDGSGDFTTFYAACHALKDDTTKKTIFVQGGVYDVLQEMGGQNYIDSIPSDVTSGQWTTYSNFISENTKIVGLGEVTLNFFPDYDEVKCAVIGPVGFFKNVELYNITINASNCRYCIHYEAGTETNNKNAKIVLENVKLYKTIQNASGGYGQAFGAGHGNNVNIICKDCLFSSNNQPTWSSHDNTNADYSNFIFENCIFLSSFYDNAPVLRLGSANSTTGVKNVRLTNCHIGGKIVLNDNASHPNNYALTLFKSGNPTIESTTGTITIDPVIIQ